MEKKYCKIVSASEAENCVRQSKQCKQIPSFLFIQTFHPPGLSLVLWPSLKSVSRTVPVGVSPCVSKGKIKSWFPLRCTASSPPRDTHAALQHFRGWIDFWRSPRPFNCGQGQPLPVSSCTSGWYHNYGSLQTRCTPCALYTPLLWPRHTGAHRDSLLAIWKDLKVHIISEHK